MLAIIKLTISREGLAKQIVHLAINKKYVCVFIMICIKYNQLFHLMLVMKYVTVLPSNYPANFTRILDSLCFTGHCIVPSI